MAEGQRHDFEVAARTGYAEGLEEGYRQGARVGMLSGIAWMGGLAVLAILVIRYWVMG